MNEKQNFISFAELVFNTIDMKDYLPTIEEKGIDITKAFNYFDNFKNSKSNSKSEKCEITEKGIKILEAMQQDKDKGYKAKDIAEILFVSPRSIPGAIRKLVVEEYVSKDGGTPNKYSLTQKGKDYVIKNPQL